MGLKREEVMVLRFKNIFMVIALIASSFASLSNAKDEQRGSVTESLNSTLLRDCSKPFSLYPSKEMVDPELLPLLGIIAEGMALDLPPRQRYKEGVYEVVKASRPPLPEEVIVKEVQIPGADTSASIRALVYSPKETKQNRPAILDIHGGSWVLGFPEMNEFRNANLAKDINAVVVSIDYRLAPENPFPAALDDSFAALKWLHDNASDLGIDPTKIAVSGDSAGGSIAAGLALYAKEKSSIKIGFQVLVYPALDDRTGTTLDPTCKPGTAPSPPVNVYLGKVPDENVSPYAFPARAKSLTELPPTFIAVGAADPLVVHSIDYAKRLMGDGVPTELHIYPGAVHGFDMSTNATVSNNFYRDLRDALDRALNKKN